MGGGYYFYTAVWPDIAPDKPDGDETVSAMTEYVKLVDRSTEDLLELTVNYQSEEFVLTKEKVMEKAQGSSTEREVTRWKLTNRSDIRTDSSKLSTAASNFCVITTSKVVEEDAYDLTQYGFGGPDAAKATGKFNDGEVVTLEIGNKNPTNDAYYIRKENENTVFLGSTYSAERIMINKTAIADLTLFDFTDEDLAGVSMQRGGEPLFTAVNKGDYQWELEHPVIAPFNMTAQGQIMESVIDVSAMEFVEMNAKDLAEYGLAKPRYTLTLHLTEDREPVELHIGREKNVRSSVFAMMGGTKDVFVLSIERFIYLDKPIKEFVDAFAYIVNINDVSHIQADFDGRSVMIDIDADMSNDTDDVFIVDGVDVSNLNNEKDRSIFRLFYQALIGITIYDIEPDEAPSGSAEISFLYELKKEPHSMLVEFIEKDERLYYVFRNGVYAGISVEKRLFDKPDEGLRAMYAAMRAGMDNMQ